jgi:uncharacterized membrane protein (DUF485 family)
MSHPSQPGDGQPEPQDGYEAERHLPRRHSPLPDLDETGGRREPDPQEFLEVQRSDDFTRLRSRFRRFAFPFTVAFLAWYFLYVLLSTYAVEFMSIRIIGYVNLGLLLGLAQFLTTFLLTWAYVHHANNNLDPMAEQLREQMEGH